MLCLNMKITLFVVGILLLLSGSIQAGDPENNEDPGNKLTISGHVKDKQSGEDLIGATVFVKEINGGTITNAYGFYSISLKPGKYTIRYSYVGYQTIEKELDLKKNINIDIELDRRNETLDEVVIKGEATNANVTKTQMSVSQMDTKTINKIPALMGEVDVIKAIQLLPGVQTTAEGSSGFSVRGGAPDQNLILLDEAVVYNPSHLMGFFSVFNNDAIKDVKLYKGDIPAAYGGRLSSLLDIRMKDGNLKKYKATGGIGIISSRLTLEGPIKKDKASFIVSGRRTYADIFLMFSSDEELKKSKMYFYDLNAKINYSINENNRIYVSSYFGQDKFANDYFKISWGNETETIRWNHLFNGKLFSNFTFIRNKFNYNLGTPPGEATGFDWKSSNAGYSIKADFSYYANANNSVKFGFMSTYHENEQGTFRGVGDESFFNEYVIPKKYSLESGIYINNQQKIGNWLTLKYGLRYSMFNNIGTDTIYIYDEEYNKIDSSAYSKGDFYNTFSGLEPRLGIIFLLNEFSSLKASYSRTRQYIHLAMNSTAGTPLDVWFPSSPNVKPQIGDQVAVGYFRNFKKNTIETSVEAYYKHNNNAIDFKDHTLLLGNKELEGELRYGKSWSYGLELLVKLNKKKINGWISYTYSRTWREIEEINNGKKYPAPYDRPNDISIVLNYQLSKRIEIGANWIYYTGSPVTYPTGRFTYGNVIAPVYSDRNAYRLPDYHRLDISITLKGKEKPNKKWYGELNLSVYNAYNRKNPWVINFVEDENNPNERYGEMIYIGIIPAITYNFHFNK